MRGEAYYRTRLSGERLRSCYELAPQRVQQYLDAEISHVLGRVQAGADCSSCEVAVMDAKALGFRDRAFDMAVCIQNGICAFRVDPRKLLQEALRVTRRGGSVLFSSYTDEFWPHRLAWFELQADQGLVGEIDCAATTRGEIVCKDGFRFGSFGVDEFAQLCDELSVQATIVEVDDSSVFCEISIPR